MVNKNEKKVKNAKMDLRLIKGAGNIKKIIIITLASPPPIIFN
ncbi:MAG: hypothetical protein P8Y97_15015 [Candidatus Lokiarchaeota archaeon]